jgi:uncharacterized protein YndB with AHSA1/START domain
LVIPQDDAGEAIMKESVPYASFPLPKPQAGTDLPPGTVQVSVFIPAPLETVWAAMTQRDQVRKWFGDLSADLKAGGAARLDFGDGDFFEIRDVALNSPRLLRYQWRFLGTGPSNAIEWSNVPEDGGVRLTVTDQEPNRTAATVDELTEGWTDFLRRLQVFGASGQNTRYSWRRQFDGSIELASEPAAAAGRLFATDDRNGWLPWTGNVAPEALVTMIDHVAPHEFRIGNIDRPTPFALYFTLACRQWLSPTSCKLQIQPRPQGCLLVVSQGGWEGISDSDAERGAQRQRFGELWIAAMQRAQRATGN